MRASLAILCFACIVVGSFAAVATSIRKDPANPGKCTITPDLVLSPGETVKDPKAECAKIECGKDSVATFTTCGAVHPPPNCKFGEQKDPSLDYPGCCDRVISCVL